MASGGGGGGSGSQSDSAIVNAVSLLGSAGVRNATLTCLAAAGIAVSVRSLLATKRSDDKRSSSSDKKSEKHIDLPERKGAGTYQIDRHGNGATFSPISRRESGSTTAFESSTMFSPHTGRPDRAFNAGNANSNSGRNAVIAIFWDVDNCQPNSGASGHQVAQAIRRAAQSAGPDPDRTGSIVSFKAYLELSSETSTPNAAQVQLRSELQGSGVSLIDTPKSGRKDVADKMMIADLLSFAIDKRPPALIVLLSGDRDFAYPLGILRNRGYEILLITPPSGVTPILEASANYKLRWRQDVLKIDFDANGRPYDKSARTNGVSKPVTAVTVGETAAESTNNVAAKQSSPTDLVPDAVRGADGSKIPPVFAPLISVLESFAAEGSQTPLRSRVSVRLQSLSPNVFSKAHASGWGEYVSVAEAAGIVVLGPGLRNGMEWIALPANVPQADEGQAAKREKHDDAVAGNVDVGIFAPLIQAHQNIRRRSTTDCDPTVREMCSEIDSMVRRGVAGSYKHTGAGAFDLYVKQAFKARFARLAPSENGTVIQLHPRYVDVKTDLSDEGKEVSDDATSKDVPQSTLKPAAEIQPLKSNNVSPAKPSVALPSSTSIWSESPTKNASVTPAIFPAAPANVIRSAFITNAKSFPHQPSGEMMNVAYFPLANYLLSQRSDGTYAVRESHLHQSLAKHHKLGRSIQSWQAYQDYLRCAVVDDVIKIVISDGVRHVQLADRLCKGEGGDKHKGFVRGQNSNWRSSGAMDRRGSSASAGQSENGRDADVVSSSPKITHRSPQSKTDGQTSDDSNGSSDVKPSAIDADGRFEAILNGDKLNYAVSPQFDTVARTTEDRQRFKALIDALVSLRKRGLARASRSPTTADAEFEAMVLSAVEPLRGAVATTLVEVSANAANDATNGTSLAPVKAPGAWLQSMGYASFTDYYNEAERKGFVHLVSNEAGRERIRLAKRYEDMFFS